MRGLDHFCRQGQQDPPTPLWGPGSPAGSARTLQSSPSPHSSSQCSACDAPPIPGGGRKMAALERERESPFPAGQLPHPQHQAAFAQGRPLTLDLLSEPASPAGPPRPRGLWPPRPPRLLTPRLPWSPSAPSQLGCSGRHSAGPPPPRAEPQAFPLLRSALWEAGGRRSLLTTRFSWGREDQRRGRSLTTELCPPASLPPGPRGREGDPLPPPPCLTSEGSKTCTVRVGGATTSPALLSPPWGGPSAAGGALRWAPVTAMPSCSAFLRSSSIS